MLFIILGIAFLTLKIFSDLQGVLDPNFVSYKELELKGQ